MFITKDLGLGGGRANTGRLLSLLVNDQIKGINLFDAAREECVALARLEPAKSSKHRQQVKLEPAQSGQHRQQVELEPA